MPGTNIVVAKKPGYAPKQVSVNVPAGADVALDIGLTLDPNADFDDDGVLDAKDNCTEAANPDQHDADRDGQGDASEMDYDDDGLADEDDNCPLVANKDQKDSDGDGVGDACPPGSAPASADPGSDGEGSERPSQAADSADDAGDGGCASGGRGPSGGAVLVARRLRARGGREAAPARPSMIRTFM